MFIRKKTRYDGKVALQVCDSWRENGKVRQKVLRHIGTADANDTETINRYMLAAELHKAELEKEQKAKELASAPSLPFEMSEANSQIQCVVADSKTPKVESDEPEELLINANQCVEQSRVVEGIHTVFGSVLDKFNLEILLGRRQYSVLREIIMSRIALPSSKLKASENLARKFNVDLPVERMYRLMDALEEQEGPIQAAIFGAFRPLIGESVEVLFFDVTTLYCESDKEDGLRRFGFSKDQKTHLTQVVLALASTKEGLPVGYKLFPGNTAETSTLLQAVEEWKKILYIDQITIIADRAMMSEANIALLEASKFKYVIAAKLKLLPKAMQEKILSRANEKIINQNEADVLGVQEHTYEGRRLIVSHSTKRARKDASDREQILKKLQAKIGPKGSTKKLVTNRGYLSVIKEEGNSKVTIDEVKVAAAARWDGLHGVITNLKEAAYEEVLSLYRRLWVIEESFRINKNTLEMRPIYHHAPRRVRAHILLSYIAFGACRYVQKRVAMQYEELSVDRIRAELIEVQYSILRDEKTECTYRLPSKMSVEARKIYSVFNLKRGRYLTKEV
jgi:transposase